MAGCLRANPPTPPQKKTKKNTQPWTASPKRSLYFLTSSSDFVVDVGGTLRRHFLDDVDRVSIVPAHLLVVRAEDAVGSPERYDDVAGLRAVVVATAPAAPLGRGQRAERQRGGVLRRVLAVPPPVLEQQHDQHDDDDDEDDAAGGDAGEQGHLGADDAGGLAAAAVPLALSGRDTC